MAKHQHKKIEFGDFQTPLILARQVVDYLQACGERPCSVLEPTCGVGRFLSAAIGFPSVRQLVGYEINADHLQRAGQVLQTFPSAHVDLQQRDFFQISWKQTLQNLQPPILILGNPPWVTASALGEMGSANLPVKSNFQRRSGLDAITGKANFDIAEYMLIRLAEALSITYGSMAMLVKTSVARRFLAHAWSNGLPISSARMLSFDSAQHFGVSAEACLLYCLFADTAATTDCEICDLNSPQQSIGSVGWIDDRLCADRPGFIATRTLMLRGKPPEYFRWRSGVKHDCASVMELQRIGSRLLNGENENVEIEDSFLYPLIKGSALAGGRVQETSRHLIVPQRFVGEDTDSLASRAPATWRYLLAHAARLNARSSSIYRKQPRFSIFGIGEYTFRPFKVAISAMYKQLQFQVVPPIEGKPVVFDDTVNFLGFSNASSAHLVATMLQSEMAQRFYRSRIFWDSKRPITAQLLGELDLFKLANSLDKSAEFGEAVRSQHSPEFVQASLF